jgi:molybdate transport system ATP-binding protein
VLYEIDWTVSSGEHWLITGNNGSGKSTLAEAITGRHRIVGGKRTWPRLKGEPSRSIQLVSFTDTSSLFHNANAVHYYQQRFNAFDADGHLTVRDYLLSNGHDEGSAIKSLTLLGAKHLIELERIKLSSGQTRKLLLAKALAGRPEILIIDNPYLGLDAGSREALNVILDGLVSGGNISLVLVGSIEHPPSCISHHLRLEAGKVTFAGKRSEDQEADNPALPAKKSLDEIILHFKQTKDITDYKNVLRLKDLSIRYGEKVIFNKLNWAVQPGEKWVISGNNGSGKSTLLSLIYADHPQAYANQIYLFDHRRGRGESIWDIKRRIGFTSPELHAFFDGSLTAEGVILSGLNDTFLPPAKTTPTQINLMKALIRFSGLDAETEKPFRYFSTGEQRLLLFLRALIKAPPVLLLDEPFQGLDSSTIERCRRLLDVVLTPDQTLIFISHFRKEVPDTVTLELSL